MRFWSLKDLSPYEEVRQLQRALVDQRSRNQIPDTFLFLEHEPVITRGRGLQHTGEVRPRQMPLQTPLPSGISYSEVERGGDLTYHGPGQLVLYPICKLDGNGFAPDRDVSGFLRKLESIVIASLADRLGENEQVTSRENSSGVWIGPKKIASIGIAVRKWVSYHGIAVNAVNDLAPFYLVSPCGFSPEVMTRLADWVDLGPDWRSRMELDLAKRILGLEPEITSLTLAEAKSIIGSAIHPAFGPPGGGIFTSSQRQDESLSTTLDEPFGPPGGGIFTSSQRQDESLSSPLNEPLSSSGV